MRPRPDFWGLATAGQLLPKQASKSLPLNQHRAQSARPGSGLSGHCLRQSPHGG